MGLKKIKFFLQIFVISNFFVFCKQTATSVDTRSANSSNLVSAGSNCSTSGAGASDGAAPLQLTLGAIKASLLQMDKPQVINKDYSKDEKTLANTWILMLQPLDSDTNPNYVSDFANYEICAAPPGVNTALMPQEQKCISNKCLLDPANCQDKKICICGKSSSYVEEIAIPSFMITSASAVLTVAAQSCVEEYRALEKDASGKIVNCGSMATGFQFQNPVEDSPVSKKITELQTNQYKFQKIAKELANVSVKFLKNFDQKSENWTYLTNSKEDKATKDQWITYVNYATGWASSPSDFGGTLSDLMDSYLQEAEDATNGTSTDSALNLTDGTSTCTPTDPSSSAATIPAAPADVTAASSSDFGPTGSSSDSSTDSSTDSVDPGTSSPAVDPNASSLDPTAPAGGAASQADQSIDSSLASASSSGSYNDSGFDPNTTTTDPKAVDSAAETAGVKSSTLNIGQAVGYLLLTVGGVWFLKWSFHRVAEWNARKKLNKGFEFDKLNTVGKAKLATILGLSQSDSDFGLKASAQLKVLQNAKKISIKGETISIDGKDFGNKGKHFETGKALDIKTKVHAAGKLPFHVSKKGFGILAGALVGVGLIIANQFGAFGLTDSAVVQNPNYKKQIDGIKEFLLEVIRLEGVIKVIRAEQDQINQDLDKLVF